MIAFDFSITGAEAQEHSAAPQLNLGVVLRQRGEVPIEGGTLRCQVRIDPAARAYSAGEREALWELFGAPDHWGRSLRSLVWQTTQTALPSFTERAELSLPLPCSYDFALASVKYFDGLQGGLVPLQLLFSGTVFYRAPSGAVQVWPVPWSSEASYALPVERWREVIESHYANQAFVGVRKDVFERLRHFKARGALPTWELAFERLLALADAAADGEARAEAELDEERAAAAHAEDA